MRVAIHVVLSLMFAGAALAQPAQLDPKAALRRDHLRDHVDDAPRRRVTRIADDTLPFGGGWIYELAPIRRARASRSPRTAS